MQKEPIGKMKCPECGFADAVVKEDKNGMAYRWCPDCYAQYFTRDAERDKRLRAVMAPLKTNTEQPAGDGAGAQRESESKSQTAHGTQPVASVAPKPAPVKAPRKAFDLADLK